MSINYNEQTFESPRYINSTHDLNSQILDRNKLSPRDSKNNSVFPIPSLNISKHLPPIYNNKIEQKQDEGGLNFIKSHHQQDIKRGPSQSSRQASKTLTYRSQKTIKFEEKEEYVSPLPLGVNLFFMFKLRKIMKTMKSRLFSYMKTRQQFLSVNIELQFNTNEKIVVFLLLQQICITFNYILSFLLGDLSMDIDLQDEQNTDSFIYRFKKLILSTFICKQLKVLLESIPIFSPSHPILLFWNFLQLLTILMFFFYIPINISVGMKGVKLEDLMTVELKSIGIYVNFLDVLISMNTGVSVQKTDGRFLIIILGITLQLISLQILWYNIISNYINYKKLFASDLIQQTGGEWIYLLFFAKVKVFGKLLKKIEDSFYISNKTDSMIKLLKLLCMVLFQAHIMACVWILIAHHQTDGTDTWITALEIQDSGWQRKYISAFYFSIMTMSTVGYGDITPRNVKFLEDEVYLCIFTMLFACGVFGYAIGSIQNTFAAFFQQENDLKNQLQVINSYMYNKKISYELQFQVREYLEYYLNSLDGSNSDEEIRIINMLSDNLRENLLMEAKKQLVASKMFRMNFSDMFIRKCIHLVHDSYIQPEELVHANYDNIDENQSIYFIEQGRMNYIIECRNRYQDENTFFYKNLIELKAGNYYGEYQFFTGQIDDKMKLRAVEFTKLLYIRRKDFIELLQDFPEDFQTFCQIRDKILYNNDFDQINQQCQSCPSTLHQTHRCIWLHYVPDRYRLIKEVEADQKDREFYIRAKVRKTSRNLRLCQDTAYIYFSDNQSYISNLYYQQEIDEYEEDFTEIDSENDVSQITNSKISNIDRPSLVSIDSGDLQDQKKKKDEQKLATIHSQDSKKKLFRKNSTNKVDEVFEDIQISQSKNPFQLNQDKIQKLSQSSHFIVPDQQNFKSFIAETENNWNNNLQDQSQNKTQSNQIDQNQSQVYYSFVNQIKKSDGDGQPLKKQQLEDKNEDSNLVNESSNEDNEEYSFEKRFSFNVSNQVEVQKPNKKLKRSSSDINILEKNQIIQTQQANKQKIEEQEQNQNLNDAYFTAPQQYKKINPDMSDFKQKVPYLQDISPEKQQFSLISLQNLKENQIIQQQSPTFREIQNDMSNLSDINSVQIGQTNTFNRPLQRTTTLQVQKEKIYPNTPCQSKQKQINQNMHKKNQQQYRLSIPSDNSVKGIKLSPVRQQINQTQSQSKTQNQTNSEEVTPTNKSRISQKIQKNANSKLSLIDTKQQDQTQIETEIQIEFENFNILPDLDLKQDFINYFIRHNFKYIQNRYNTLSEKRYQQIEEKNQQQKQTKFKLQAKRRMTMASSIFLKSNDKTQLRSNKSKLTQIIKSGFQI